MMMMMIVTAATTAAGGIGGEASCPPIHYYLYILLWQLLCFEDLGAAHSLEWREPKSSTYGTPSFVLLI